MKYLLLFIYLSCTSTSAVPIKSLFVTDHLVDCEGVSSQQCMLIKENPDDASSQKFVLKDVISKSNTSGEDLLGKWKVIKIRGLESINIFPTFEFMKEENKVGGFAGCNEYFANYEVKGTELKIGAAGATRKMCQDMSVEDVFLKQLGEIAYYKVVKSELHLFDLKDNLVMLAISQ